MCQPKEETPCINKGTPKCTGQCDKQPIQYGTIGHHYDKVFTPVMFATKSTSKKSKKK